MNWTNARSKAGRLARHYSLGVATALVVHVLPPALAFIGLCYAMDISDRLT